MHCAVANGFENVVELLLSKGANLNAKGSNTGRTPLFLALDIQRPDIARLLVQNGAKLNITDHYGKILQVRTSCVQYYSMQVIINGSGNSQGFKARCLHCAEIYLQE
jgi:ankyrin repeat protein